MAVKLKEPEYTHLVFKDNVLSCEHCGATFTLELPIEIVEFTKQVKTFNKAHKDCVQKSDEVL